jgi:hypothetical protein
MIRIDHGFLLGINRWRWYRDDGYPGAATFVT